MTTTVDRFYRDPLYLALEAASVAGLIAGAYHGYRRNESIGWSLAWGFLGSIFPYVTIPIAVAQGFGKPRSGLTGLINLSADLTTETIEQMERTFRQIEQAYNRNQPEQAHDLIRQLDRSGFHDQVKQFLENRRSLMIRHGHLFKNMKRSITNTIHDRQLQPAEKSVQIKQEMIKINKAIKKLVVDRSISSRQAALMKTQLRRFMADQGFTERFYETELQGLGGLGSNPYHESEHGHFAPGSYVANRGQGSYSYRGEKRRLINGDWNPISDPCGKLIRKEGKNVRCWDGQTPKYWRVPVYVTQPQASGLTPAQMPIQPMVKATRPATQFPASQSTPAPLPPVIRRSRKTGKVQIVQTPVGPIDPTTGPVDPNDTIPWIGADDRDVEGFRGLGAYYTANTLADQQRKLQVILKDIAIKQQQIRDLKDSYPICIKHVREFKKQHPDTDQKLINKMIDRCSELMPAHTAQAIRLTGQVTQQLQDAERLINKLAEREREETVSRANDYLNRRR